MIQQGCFGRVYLQKSHNAEGQVWRQILVLVHDGELFCNLESRLLHNHYLMYTIDLVAQYF